MKHLSMLVILFLLAGPAFGRDLVIAISQANWQSIPAAKKAQAVVILQECTKSKTPIKLSWILRKVSNGNIWGFASFANDAWVLKQKQKIDSAKITQINNLLSSYGFQLRWTEDFWADVAAAGLEPIPITE